MLALLVMTCSASRSIAQSSTAPNTVSTVEVIGRTSPDNLQSATPLTVVGAEAISQTGATTLEQLLQTVPSFGFQGVGATASGGYGVYFVDLRSLNFNRTLTLVDDHLFVLSGIKTDEAVDLNNVPIGLIDHIEVKRSGSEPEYGPDSVAGVVDVVLKKNFDGLAMTAYGGTTVSRDDTTGEYTITWGHNFSRGNLTVNAGYFYRGAITQSSRDWAAEPITAASLNPNGTLSEIVGSPATPGGHATSANGAINAEVLGPGQDFRPFNAAADSYNFANAQDLQGSLRRATANLIGHYDLTEAITASIEVLYSHRESVFALPPQSLGLVGTVKNPEGFVVPADNPFNPFGQDVELQRVLAEVGPQDTTATGDTYRVVAALEGALAGRIKWKFSFDHGESATTYNVANSVNLTKALELADCDAPSLGCGDFFGPGSLSQRDADFIRYTDVSHSKYVENVAELAAETPLFSLPGGPATLAVGGELRYETGYTHLDPVTLAGDQAGPNSRDTNGAYHSREVFAKVDLPLLRDLPLAKALEVNGAARYSDFNLYGAFPTWKVSLSWALDDSFRFRATQGLARRPPAIAEAFGGLAANFTVVQDPCDASSGLLSNPVVMANCRAAGLPANFTQNNALINIASGGNPHLTTESSTSFTLGGVFTPKFATGLSASIDYYHYKIRNAIDSLADTNANFIPDACYMSPNLTSPLCADVQRTVSGPNTGQINEILGLDENIGAITSDGIDFDVSYRHAWAEGQSLLIDWQSNLLLNYLLAEQGVTTQYAGAFASLISVGSYARFKSLMTITGRDGPITVAGRINYIGGAKVLGLDPATTPDTSAPPIWYFDMLCSYRVGKVTYSIGANNITNQKPPILLDGVSNTDLNTYDVDGTFVYFRVAASF
jgi:iron complex outermembrane receptor protein